MSQQVYGFPFPMPPGIDYFEVSGLDVGFTGNLVPTTNESFSFYMPVPGSIDRFEQTFVVHALEFMIQIPHSSQDDTVGALLAMLSSRGEVPAPTLRPQRSAASDAFWKAQFARNIYHGLDNFHETDASLASPWEWKNDSVSDALYFPPAALDQWNWPTHIHLFNQNVTVAAPTGDETVVNFQLQAAWSMIVWFTPRDLTNAEKDDRTQNASGRFARRDA